jgi:hypothetical protein
MRGNLSSMATTDLPRVSAPPSPRAVALRGVLALAVAALIELGIVALANAGDWPAGAFYLASALALCVVIAVAVPIIEPPREAEEGRFEEVREEDYSRIPPSPEVRRAQRRAR